MLIRRHCAAHTFGCAVVGADEQQRWWARGPRPPGFARVVAPVALTCRADGVCEQLGCRSDRDCAAGYTCSATAITAVDGGSGKQCIPDSGSCVAGGGCVDDAWEDNDTRAQAAANPALGANDIYDLTSCPMASGTDDDEDWFELDVPADRSVTLAISGGAATDLDLALYTATGTLIQSSTSLTSDESITRCLAQGLYYVRVYACNNGASEPFVRVDVVSVRTPHNRPEKVGRIRLIRSSRDRRRLGRLPRWPSTP